MAAADKIVVYDRHIPSEPEDCPTRGAWDCRSDGFLPIDDVGVGAYSCVERQLLGLAEVMKAVRSKRGEILAGNARVDLLGLVTAPLGTADAPIG